MTDRYPSLGELYFENKMKYQQCLLFALISIVQIFSTQSHEESVIDEIWENTNLLVKSAYKELDMEIKKIVHMKLANLKITIDEIFKEERYIECENEIHTFAYAIEQLIFNNLDTIWCPKNPHKPHTFPRQPIQEVIKVLDSSRNHVEFCTNDDSSKQKLICRVLEKVSAVIDFTNVVLDRKTILKEASGCFDQIFNHIKTICGELPISIGNCVRVNNYTRFLENLQLYPLELSSLGIDQNDQIDKISQFESVSGNTKLEQWKTLEAKVMTRRDELNYKISSIKSEKLKNLNTRIVRFMQKSYAKCHKSWNRLFRIFANDVQRIMETNDFDYWSVKNNHSVISPIEEVQKAVDVALPVIKAKEKCGNADLCDQNFINAVIDIVMSVVESSPMLVEPTLITNETATRFNNLSEELMKILGTFNLSAENCHIKETNYTIFLEKIGLSPLEAWKLESYQTKEILQLLEELNTVGEDLLQVSKQLNNQITISNSSNRFDCIATMISQVLEFEISQHQAALSRLSSCDTQHTRSCRKSRLLVEVVKIFLKKPISPKLREEITSRFTEATGLPLLPKGACKIDTLKPGKLSTHFSIDA